MTSSRLPAPGRHGGDGVAVAAALGLDPAAVLDLSQNLNPVAPDPAPVVARHLDAVGRYPDPAAAASALAAAIGVDRDQLLLTNGGSEAIALVAAELGGGVAAEPEFALHPRAATGPRWRSNPHNPTGRLAVPGGGPGEVKVWDEAFYQLATGTWTRGDHDRGAVVVGSLTKLFACPGLRVGYVLAAPDVVARLADRQPHWSVNGLAAATLPELLAGADLDGWRSQLSKLRTRLVELLDAHGLSPQPSDANFVLCANARNLRARLAPHGVVVRDCTSFGLPGHARIAVPDEAGLARLEEALCAAG